MVKRLNISVPDELYDRLQKVNESINISKVCQGAIMDKVATVEIAKSGDLIDFLRSEKREAEMSDRDLGRKVAEDAINKRLIGYIEFKAIVELYELMEKYGNEYENLKGLLDQQMSLSVWDSMIEPTIEESMETNKAFDVDAFSLGFASKVVDVWAEVEDKI